MWRRKRQRTTTRLRSVDSDWCSRAASAAADLTTALEEIPSTTPRESPQQPLPDDLGAIDARLEPIVDRFARLTATAPTSMDERVTRAVGTSARALHQTTRQLQRGSQPSTGPASGVDARSQFFRRRADLATAVADLQRHLEVFGAVHDA